MEKRVVVTGGAGFIGSALCRRLVRHGVHVLNLDKLTYAANLHSLDTIRDSPLYQFHQVDICDSKMVLETIENYKPQIVFHLAAESHVDRSIINSQSFIDTNIVGTFRVLESVRAYWMDLPQKEADRFRFIHISTDEVYGSLGAEGAFTEATAYDPSSPYSASKAAADHLVSAWMRTYGLPAIITNCSNNYGPFHFPEKLIPLTILNALHGRELPVYGTGQNIRDWLYVDDHVAALDLIATKGRVGETYNIGGRNERTNLAVVEQICDLLDEMRPKETSHRSLITFVRDRPGHDLRYAIDASKLEQELGWQARETFDSGIEKTVRWYLANEWWWRPLREKVYRGERLGLV